MTENLPTKITPGRRTIKKIQNNREEEVFPLLLEDRNISREITDAQKCLRENLVKMLCEALTGWHKQRIMKKQLAQPLEQSMKPTSGSFSEKPLSLADFSLKEIFSFLNPQENLQNFVEKTLFSTLEPLFGTEVLQQTIKQSRLNVSFILKPDKKLMQLVEVIRFVHILLNLPEIVRNSSHILKALQNDLLNLNNKNTVPLEKIENEINAKERAILKYKEQEQKPDNIVSNRVPPQKETDDCAKPTKKETDDCAKPTKKKKSNNIETIQNELMALNTKKKGLETPLKLLEKRISVFGGLCQHAETLISGTDIESIIQEICSSDKKTAVSEEPLNSYEQICLELKKLKNDIKETGLDDAMETTLQEAVDLHSIQKIFSFVPIVLMKEKKNYTIHAVLGFMIILAFLGIKFVKFGTLPTSEKKETKPIFQPDFDDELELLNLENEITRNLELLNIAISNNNPEQMKDPTNTMNEIFMVYSAGYMNETEQKNNKHRKRVFEIASKTFFSLSRIWEKHEALSEKHTLIRNNFNNLLYSLAKLTLKTSTSLYSVRVSSPLTDPIQKYLVERQSDDKETYSISISKNPLTNTWIIDVEGWEKIALELNNFQENFTFTFFQNKFQEKAEYDRAHAMLLLFIVKALSEGPKYGEFRKNYRKRLKFCVKTPKFQIILARSVAIARHAFLDSEVASFGDF